MWVLGTEFGLSERKASALNCCALSPAPSLPEPPKTFSYLLRIERPLINKSGTRTRFSGYWPTLFHSYFSFYILFPNSFSKNALISYLFHRNNCDGSFLSNIRVKISPPGSVFEEHHLAWKRLIDCLQDSRGASSNPQCSCHHWLRAHSYILHTLVSLTSSPVLIVALQSNYEAAVRASWGEMSRVWWLQSSHLRKQALCNSSTFQAHINVIIAVVPNLAV